MLDPILIDLMIFVGTKTFSQMTILIHSDDQKYRITWKKYLDIIKKSGAV